jgi:hypothetical protein
MDARIHPSGQGRIGRSLLFRRIETAVDIVSDARRLGIRCRQHKTKPDFKAYDHRGKRQQSSRYSDGKTKLLAPIVIGGASHAATNGRPRS